MPRYSNHDDADSSPSPRYETRLKTAEGSRINRRKQATPKKFNKNNALQEIRSLQHSTDMIIPRLPFGRLVREIMMRLTPSAYRIQSTALEALQESAETYLVQLMEDGYRCTYHRNRVTLEPKDIQLVRLIRGMADMGLSG